jgi:hypothetical protein
MGVVGLRSGGAALRGDESVRLELASELAEGFWLIAGKDERGFDRLESGSCGEAGAGSRVLGERELWGRGARRDALRGCRRLRMNDVLDRSYAPDRFFRENAELEGESAGELAFKIDWATAHAGDYAGVLNFGTFELDENNGLLGAEEIGHDADDFEVELFDLVAGENGVGIALHAGANFIERKDFGGGRSLGAGREE